MLDAVEARSGHIMCQANEFAAAVVVAAAVAAATALYLDQIAVVWQVQHFLRWLQGLSIDHPT